MLTIFAAVPFALGAILGFVHRATALAVAAFVEGWEAGRNAWNGPS